MEKVGRDYNLLDCNRRGLFFIFVLFRGKKANLVVGKFAGD